MRALLAVIVAALLTVGGASAASTASTLYVTPTGSDASACTASAPCRSFKRAVDVAQSGDTVEVMAGTYGAQFFAAGVGSSQGVVDKELTFHGQPGNKVRQIHFGSGHFTFDGIDVDAGGVKTSGAAFENGGAPFVFRNGAIGNVTDEKGALVDGPGAVFDGVRFHDVVLKTNGVHLECIQAYVVPGFTLRNSTFTNCGIMGLSLGYAEWWSPKPPAYTGVVIEGNTFNAPVPSNNYALAIWANKDSCGDTCGWGVMTDYVIRNNFVWSLINRMTTDSSTVICGNTGPGIDAGWDKPCSTTPPPPPPPEEEPPPPAPSCDAACEQAYKDRVAALELQVDALTSERDSARAERDALRAKLDEIHALSAP